MKKHACISIGIVIFLLLPTAGSGQLQDSLRVLEEAVICFGVSQSERDSLAQVDSGFEEVLSDFQFYVGKIRSFLDSCNISFGETTASAFSVIEDGRKPIEFLRDSLGADVGIILIRPGKKPRVLPGVFTDQELRLEVVKYFGLNSRGTIWPTAK